MSCRVGIGGRSGETPLVTDRALPGGKKTNHSELAPDVAVVLAIAAAVEVDVFLTPFSCCRAYRLFSGAAKN